jgi:hypothetical protein
MGTIDDVGTIFLLVIFAWMGLVFLHGVSLNPARTTKEESARKPNHEQQPEWRLLEIFALPWDTLLSVTESPFERLISLSKGCNVEGKFEPGSCGKRCSIPFYMECEVCARVSIFMLCYFLPFPWLFWLVYNRSYWLVIYAPVLIFLWVVPVDYVPGLAKTYPYRWTPRYWTVRLIWHRDVTSDASPTLFFTVPHGVIPLSLAFIEQYLEELTATALRPAQASVLAYMPVIRQLSVGQGCIPATREKIAEHLLKGDSVPVVADGIAGMFHAKPGHEVAFIKNRKGVARLALQTGASVTPMYCFGNTGMYQCVSDPFGLMQYFSRKLQVSLIWFAGRWGSPVSAVIDQTACSTWRTRL